MTNKTTVYELIGLPASGKSSLLDSLSVKVRESEIRDRWIELSLFKKVIFIFKTFAKVKLTLNVLKFYFSLTTKSRNVTLRCLRLPIYLTWITHQKDTLYLDQGCIQNLWSILVRQTENGWCNKALNTLLSSIFEHERYRVVYIQVNDKISINRIQIRSHGKSLYDNKSIEELNKTLQQGRNCMDHIVNSIQQIHPNRFSMVENNQTLEIGSKNLEEAFKAL